MPIEKKDVPELIETIKIVLKDYKLGVDFKIYQEDDIVTLITFDESTDLTVDDYRGTFMWDDYNPRDYETHYYWYIIKRKKIKKIKIDLRNFPK